MRIREQGIADEALDAIARAMLAVEGRSLVYPAAGGDTTAFLTAFHPWIDEFHFNDLGYDTSSDDSFALPDGFSAEIAERPERQLRDQRPIDCTDGVRQWKHISPTTLTLNARGPAGRHFKIRRRRGFGQYAITHHEPGSIGVFVHRCDSAGDGGSNVYFLGNRPRHYEPVSHLWEKLNTRLSTRALVVTDGCLTDFKFLKRGARLARTGEVPKEVVRMGGREWRAVTVLDDRPGTVVWDTVRL